MKTLSALAFSLLIGLAVTQHVSAAPQFGGRERVQGRDRVCVYKDIRFNGWEECYNVGDEVAHLGSHTKQISSIRVFGRARVVVYEDPEFKGNSAEFSSDVPDLGLRSNGGSHTWNDQIESLRIVSDNDARRDVPFDNRRNEPPPPPNRINNGICVYDRPDYQGREQCWNTGVDVNDLKRAGNWSDRISSIRVFGRTRVVVYRDIEFRGETITIDRDTPDLAQIRGGAGRNWDRQISSLAVEEDRPGRGRGRGFSR